MLSLKMYNFPQSFQEQKSAAQRRRRKGRIQISFRFKSWGDHVNPHIPFDPIIFFMAEARSEGSSGMQQKF